ncbi:DUF2795 domain-containing protein [Actinocatenispora sera]|uniref:DUF2795 domain-containing protein n=1 Tax=Actinocatenispora sera TaxID=390989 RepID=A0A810LBS8_9ACTN|nr:DUF2795 domain-containing protein [Actinocatenispora sera]BCJ31711.1 hypothetical protein Asera_58190 [Actinocatenispora sera]
MPIDPQPGSSTNSPRRDDELAAETSGYTQGGGGAPRVEEWREPGPAGEDQPAPGELDESAGVGGSPPGMDAGDVAGRSELARYVSPSAFPGDRAALVASARDNNAPDAIVGQLDGLPEGRRYVNVSAVWEALGHGVEADDQRF